MPTEAKSFRKLVNMGSIFQLFLTDYYALTHYTQSPAGTIREKNIILGTSLTRLST